GLRHVRVAAGLEGLHVVAGERVRRHHDEWDGTKIGVRFDPAGRLVAVEAGGLGVHEDEIGALRRRHPHPVLPGLRLDQLEAGLGQEEAQDAPVLLVVLHDQDPLAHAGATWRSTRTGSVNRKVEPRPSADSTQIRPPCISTMRFAIARPRPVPPFFRAVELSACWNSSKILTWSASEIPGPVSATETTKWPSEAVPPTRPSPASVNLMALPTRFRSTWAIRRESPLPGGRSGGTVTCSLSFFSAASDSTFVATACVISSMA